jgi:GATA-binding protein
MGKQEIKRRKRIVPADVQTPSIASYSPQQPGTEIRAIEHSVSPAPTTTIDSSEIYPLHARIPVPVDFTTYQNNSHPTANQRGPSTKNLGAPSPRKRSLSATLDPNEVASGPARSVPHRPNAISSLLNPTASQDDRIDPALSALSRPTSGPSPNIQDQKVIRKEKLRREAEAMRQELERREKELQELEELEELED